LPFFSLDGKETKDQEQTIYSPFVRQHYPTLVQSKLDIKRSTLLNKQLPSKNRITNVEATVVQKPNQGTNRKGDVIPCGGLFLVLFRTSKKEHPNLLRFLKNNYSANFIFINISLPFFSLDGKETKDQERKIYSPFAQQQ
jgi:hypothetical protein